MKKYSINLASCGNPAYGQNPKQPVWGFSPNQVKQVDTIEEARQACLDFINQEPIGTLGASQWAGGQLYDNETGQQIGYISYNTRVWDMDGKEFSKDHVCKCNNCGARIIDQNPQIGAKEVYLEGNEVDMLRVEEDEGDGVFQCPNCKTDGYLSDFL